jgi:hypothetical protein
VYRGNGVDKLDGDGGGVGISGVAQLAGDRALECKAK